MRKVASIGLVVGLFVVAPGTLDAAPLLLNPGTPGMIAQNLGGANCEPDCVEDAFGLPDGTLGQNPGDALYKSDYVKGNANGTDSGPFAASYNTVFSPSADDPSDATISFVGAPSITCPNCYLAIKDGNQQPSYYFFNLSAWDGISDIVMSGFWPDKGAISHVSIWGFTPAEEEEGGSEEEGTGEGEEEGTGEGEEEGTTVPEPASMILLGLGMAAAAARMRSRNR